MEKTISRKELIRRFRNLGYKGPFSGGRHQFMIKDRKKIRIPNPHKGKDVHISLLSEILRQARISKEDWKESLIR